MAKAAAAKKNDTEVLETHEAIVIDPVSDMEPTKEEVKKDPSARVEESMNKALAKYNVTDAFLAELNTKFKNLTIKGQDDKDGYTAVHEARMIFVKTRSKIKSICEAGRESAVMIQKRWVAKQKQLIEVIQSEEARLEKLEDDFDAEKERIKQEKIEMQRNRLRGRITELLAMGAISDGVDVYLDDVTFSQTDIREADDEDYQSDILPAYKKLFDAKEIIRLENERMQNELKAEQDRQKLEFQREQDAFKLQQEEFQNEKKEAAAKKRNGRVSQLTSMGMVAEFPSGDYVFLSTSGGVKCLAPGIDSDTDELWEDKIFSMRSDIEMFKKLAEEKKQQDEDKRLEDARKKAAAELLVKEREMQLRGLGFGKSGLGYAFDLYRGLPFIDLPSHLITAQSDFEFNTDEVWAEKISKFSDWAEKKDLAIAQELKDKIINDEKERVENKRLKDLEESEQATDKEKWEKFIEELNFKIHYPTMKRQPYKGYMESAEALIKKINAIKK